MSTYTESWLSGPHSTSFYTRLYTPASSSTPSSPKGVLVFIHGFIEHVGRYEHAHNAWAARGFAVFAFDQRGFGRTALDAKRSKGSSYGKTSGPERMGDVKWAVRHAKETFPDAPVFLMGHSMGGGIVLGFPTHSSAPPDKDTVAILSGVIATSPLLRLSHPPLDFVRWIGGKAGHIFPNMPIPANVEPQFLSHDQACIESNIHDPLIQRSATLRAIDDMLSRGDSLVAENFKNWPKELPVLIVHGDEDQVCSIDASQKFFAKLPASDKHMSVYSGGFHELHNEPDGVKEKLFDECISWAEARLPSVAHAHPPSSTDLPAPNAGQVNESLVSSRL